MTTASPRPTRLTPQQVAQYQDLGYLIYDQPVLPQPKFQGLKNYFESLLTALPPGERPETMDVPHFLHPKLFDWALSPEILDLVEPIVGPNIALFATHFICKPRGNGKRVPWHEDSAYWKDLLEPMEVCTVWLAIDPSLKLNGCMQVIPKTHREGQQGFSDYEGVDATKNVFNTEIVAAQRDDRKAVLVELQPNQCSLHNARIMHGSDPNTSELRRCGWTLRFCSTAVRFNYARYDGMHQVYLARGRDLGGNHYADPTRAYPELMAKRLASTKYKTSH